MFSGHMLNFLKTTSNEKIVQGISTIIKSYHYIILETCLFIQPRLIYNLFYLNENEVMLQSVDRAQVSFRFRETVKVVKKELVGASGTGQNTSHMSLFTADRAVELPIQTHFLLTSRTSANLVCFKNRYCDVYYNYGRLCHSGEECKALLFIN